MGANRIGRINDEIKKEMSNIIRELKDPRIKGLPSVVAVEVTKDLKFAKVFISVLGDEQTQNDTLKGLTSSSGFARREIAHRLMLRNTPELTFVLDKSIEHGAHINEILHNI